MMAIRSKETPFERRERLNLETAIALSTSNHMTSQIECDSLDSDNRPKGPSRSPHFIPNSQSDEEIIQDFTVRDSPASSKQPPSTAIILPVQSSSMDAGLPVESRGPGWSMDKFHAGTSPTTDLSTHLKPKQLSNSSTSTAQTPQPPILVAPSSASPSTKPTTTRPKPRPPRLGAASIEQARERLKLRESTDSSTNPTSSSTIEQSLQDPFHPSRVKSKPPEVLQLPEATTRNVPHQTPVETSRNRQPSTTSERPILPKSPEITIPSNHEGSSRQKPPEAQAPPTNKKRKMKEQDQLETEPPRGSEKAKAKVSADGKRVRKQSAVGKASAKSLQILINLSQSSDDAADANSIPRDPIIIGGSDKTQRRRVYRNGWVLASSPEPEPDTPSKAPLTIRDKAASSVHQSRQETFAPPQATVSKDATSQPFLEIISSPLSSPSGFSAEETAPKASKHSKPTVVPKKRAPKKKATPKPKATKNRKELVVDTPAVPNNKGSPLAHEEHPAGDSTPNKVNFACPLADVQNPQLEPETLEEPDQTRNKLLPQSKARQSPRRRAGASTSQIVSIGTPVTSERIAVANKIASLSKSQTAGPSTGDHPQDSAGGTKATMQSAKAENKKKARPQALKGKSLAEIIASTCPQAKRGLRIGLPREEKHRLHVNINPNPPVQRQVKKKLKVKRGEYDSGEDDPHSKNSGSSESEDSDEKKGRKKSKSKNHKSDEDFDEEEKEEEAAKGNNYYDEEY
ncbi:hypothetical protein PTTG_01736 [Puccinia triticina 1-1 BBBD Race 1]|uniref:Uncharacterized protein n=2 Tax=Puccinia triticina TaxID=208348 RepID=A0A180G1Y1_PUCT1|nr:uncharacterized protein PtA15_11A692 [Puccinia triticina]OAV86671.1 hypothetical protein PTTG_01736 [Puccinia triticina 1-1 BBBD Race 1]WAQ90000.1 hypothetical protein PtA15_11A692 [Puccinia triticina]